MAAARICQCKGRQCTKKGRRRWWQMARAGARCLNSSRAQKCSFLLLLLLVVLALSIWVAGATWWVGVVLLVALTLSMAIGSLTGTAVPLLLKRMGADPAQGSCIVLIMITDAIAFGSLLGFAWLGFTVFNQ